MSTLSSTVSGKNWLAKLIEQAVSQNYCFRIGCTTCGTQPFGSLLMMALIREYSQLRIAGVQFGPLHAQLLCGVLSEVSEGDLPVGSDAEAALEFVVTVTWRALDHDSQERMLELCCAQSIRKILLKLAPEIGVRAMTAVMEVPSNEWEELYAELASNNLLTPKAEKLIKDVANRHRVTPSAEKCLLMLEMLQAARSRRSNRPDDLAL